MYPVGPLGFDTSSFPSGFKVKINPKCDVEVIVWKESFKTLKRHDHHSVNLSVFGGSSAAPRLQPPVGGSSLLSTGFATQLPPWVFIAPPNTTSFNSAQMHLLFPTSGRHQTSLSWIETQILQFGLQSFEIPAGDLWCGWGSRCSPSPLNSPVFVTWCIARWRLSRHKERLCQIRDMMLICVRCRGRGSLTPCTPPPPPPPTPCTERGLVFRSRDDNQDGGSRSNREPPGGYIITEDEIDLGGRRRPRRTQPLLLNSTNNSPLLFPGKVRRFQLPDKYFDKNATIQRRRKASVTQPP